MPRNAEALTQKIRAGLASAILMTVAALGLGSFSPVEAQAPKYPLFEVDPTFPKLPNNWVTGHVAGVATDRHGNAWLLTRPNTVPEASKSHAAPSVLEFDQKGKFLQSWGGPGNGYDWPDSEHGISVDYKDNVWITGSSPASASPTRRTDDMLVKFSSKGKFLLQIGGHSASGGNQDTKSVHLATDVFVDPQTNEAFVSDGYGNRRVIVFDADTGAFKRMWGAFGKPPTDWQQIEHGMPVASAAPAGGGDTKKGGGAKKGDDKKGGGGGGAPPRPTDVTGPGPDYFGNQSPFGGPTHGVSVSNDKLVYVCDRANRRIQVFTPDGKYVTQVFINRTGPSGQSVARVAFSPDQGQQFLYAGDYGNSRIIVLDRKSLKILYQFGVRGDKPGEFQGLHHLASDTKGNLYTGEVAPGARAQKFVFKGFSTTMPANALSPAQIDAQMKMPSLVPADDDGEGYNYVAEINPSGGRLLWRALNMRTQGR